MMDPSSHFNDDEDFNFKRSSRQKKKMQKQKYLLKTDIMSSEDITITASGNHSSMNQNETGQICIVDHDAIQFQDEDYLIQNQIETGKGHSKDHSINTLHEGLNEMKKIEDLIDNKNELKMIMSESSFSLPHATEENNEMKPKLHLLNTRKVQT